MGVVSCVEVGERQVAALTFDDGPSRHTERILDLLGAHRAQGTFFVCGHSVQGNEQTLRRTIADGHELGNHTWSHPRADEASDEALAREISSTSDEIERVAGVRPVLMRPPYGRDAARVAEIAAGLGLPWTVLWSVDPEDWKDVTAEEIVRIVVSGIRPGAIVDLHDGRRGHEPTTAAVARILERLGADGYRFVTVSELLAAARDRRPDP